MKNRCLFKSILLLLITGISFFLLGQGQIHKGKDNPFLQYPSIKWVQESSSAEWEARDSQGELVYKGYMWILGGTTHTRHLPATCGVRTTARVGKRCWTTLLGCTAIYL